MVSDNTIVFHIELILPDDQNMSEMLCNKGLAVIDKPASQQLAAAAAEDEDEDEHVDDKASVTAASSSFGFLPSGNQLAASEDNITRLSTKRLVTRSDGQIQIVI